MSEFGGEIIRSARECIGKPFRHHFKPVNLCEGGRKTVDACMERGMDDQGYDCSGLVIASLCEVLGIATNQWPRGLRHTQQLVELATDNPFTPGDVRLYYSVKNRIHIGIATSQQEVIHASGLTKIVEEGAVMYPEGELAAVRTIAVESLCRAIFDRRIGKPFDS